MAECMFPYHVEPKVYHKQQDGFIPVPCGKCPNCLQARASRWGFRLRKEEERSRSSYFVTLTYDTHEVSISPNGFMTLDFEHVQKFFKRLRKRHYQRFGKNYPIRYYIAGEYGTRNARPHYHCIIFNAEIPDIVKSWVNPDTNNPMGNVDIGYDCSGAAIAYTLKYINKGKIVPQHQNDDRAPERALMSKGLGANYLTPQIIKYHRNNLSYAYMTIDDGIKVPMPRYYKDKLFQTGTTRVTLIQNHPSILAHFENNAKLRKMQEAIIKELQESKPVLAMSDHERHEARRNAINTFKNYHKLKRS